MTGRRRQAFINSAVTGGVPCSSAFRNSDWGVRERKRGRRRWRSEGENEARTEKERIDTRASERARRRRWMNRSYNRGGRSFFHVRIVSDRPNRRWVPARPRRIIYINAESLVINERYRLPLSVAIDEFPQTIPKATPSLYVDGSGHRRCRSIDRYSPKGKTSSRNGSASATIIVIKFLFAPKMTCLKLPKASYT